MPRIGVEVELRLASCRMQFEPLRHRERLAVDAGDTQECEVSVLHQLALVEGAGAVEDVFAPRELSGIAELLLGELGVVVAHPVGIGKDVATENYPGQSRLDGANETLAHHRLRDAADILAVGAEEIKEVARIASLLHDRFLQRGDAFFELTLGHCPETACLSCAHGTPPVFGLLPTSLRDFRKRITPRRGVRSHLGMRRVFEKLNK